MLKRTWFATLAVLAISGTVFADDKADLQTALGKVADAANYSWSTTTENAGGFGGGGGAAPVPTTGMAEKSGYTVIAAPPGGGRGGRRGGGGGGFGGAGGPPGGGAPGGGRGGAGGAPGGAGAGGAPPAPPANLEIVMKGDKAVVKIGSDWKTTTELTATAAAAAAAGGPPGGGAPGAGGPPGGGAPGAGGPPGGGFGGGGGRGGFGGGSPEQQALTTVNALVIPTKWAKDTGPKLENVKKTADGFTADLPAETVKSMLAFAPGGGRGGAAGGAPAIELTNPKGTVKVTLKDGVPSKIVSHMTGSMDFGGNAIDMDRTITTDIKDVGSTKVTVPPEAKTKLDAAK